MKTELINISECRKELNIELPTTIVDEAIDRLSKRYSRSAKISGFRPGKVPAHVIRSRYIEQILQDIAQELIPDAVDKAMSTEGLTPVATPEILDVEVNEGKPLTFRASFETMPTVDPGSYDAFTLRQTPITIDEDAINKAMERLREQSARLEPINDRAVRHGDTVTLNLERKLVTKPNDDSSDALVGEPEQHQDVSVEIGNEVNPPGFDDELIGLTIGAKHTFNVSFPDDYNIASLAGGNAEYDIEVMALQQRIVPTLNDDFAKQTGEYKNLDELRVDVEKNLNAQAEYDTKQEIRNDLLRQLAGRVTSEVPEALVTHEVERRVEQLARHMLGQRIDPRQANVDWDAFREQQREASIGTVRSTLVLDAIAARESIEVSDDDIEQELSRQAEATGRTASAVKALVEKEGGFDRLSSGLKREKAIDLLLSRATIVEA
jgi:trigger factor